MHSRDVVNEVLGETFRIKTLSLTDQTVPTQYDISAQTVRSWPYGNRRTPRTTKSRSTYCPFCGTGAPDPKAYAYLLGLYLGDGYIGGIRNGVDYLSIFCCDTWPGLIEECAATMPKVFPVGVFRVQRRGCTEVKATSKHWRCIFPQHGKGMKHSRKIVLKPWQSEIVDEHPEAFVRGLFHSDGCRVSNRVRKQVRDQWKYYEYPRYFFNNTSQDIVDLLTHALDLLEIPWKSRVAPKPPHKDYIAVSIAQKTAVARMDAFVGPKY
ncbi:transcriptional regulator [Nocardiopsis sinuspersici]|nr:transcriptional regulator [Nocardiopsis sinuspersici]